MEIWIYEQQHLNISEMFKKKSLTFDALSREGTFISVELSDAFGLCVPERNRQEVT